MPAPYIEINLVISLEYLTQHAEFSKGRKVHAGAEAAKELAKQQEEASIVRAEREWAMSKEARERLRNGVAIPKQFARLADDQELNDHLRSRPLSILL
jgi:hypothetical protein